MNDEARVKNRHFTLTKKNEQWIEIFLSHSQPIEKFGCPQHNILVLQEGLAA